MVCLAASIRERKQNENDYLGLTKQYLHTIAELIKLTFEVNLISAFLSTFKG
jgi:hypothetical protein